MQKIQISVHKNYVPVNTTFDLYVLNTLGGNRNDTPAAAGLASYGGIDTVPVQLSKLVVGVLMKQEKNMVIVSTGI